MKLHIPDQLPAGKNAFPQHPRDLRKWLNNLPQANMGDLTRQFFTGLRALNRQTVPGKYRLEDMELLRRQARSIFDYLKKYFINRTLPLQEKSQKIVTLNQSLLQEMIFGYKIIVQNAANGVDNKIDNKMQTQAICRVLAYMNELLLRASLIYDTPPSDTWSDMHQLYAYARQKKLHTTKCNDDEHPAGKTTIESFYKQALLFALARPTAMRQNDCERVYRKLVSWESLTKLSENPLESQVDRFFCVRPEENRPPSYLTQQDLGSEQNILTLDTSELVDTIRKELGQSSQKPGVMTVGEQLSNETLKTLSSSWGISPKRRYSRAGKGGHIEAAIGLTHAAQAIRNERKKIEPGANRTGPLSPASAPSLTLQTISPEMRRMQDEGTYMTHHEIGHPDDNAWDDIARGRVLTDSYDRERKMLETEKLKLNREDDDLHWEIVNISAGGYRLRWNSDNTSRAQIGELIALHELESDGSYQWRVGVIRWMQYSRGSGLEIGAQILSPKAIAAKAQRFNKPKEEPFDCIMLPGIRVLNQHPSVLTPAHAFKTGDRLNVTVLEQEMTIKLIETSEHTGSFTQFQFANNDVATRQQKAEKKIQSEKNPDDFDEIWSSL